MYQQPPMPAADRGSIQTNAIILIIAGFICGGMLPSIFGIIALTQIDSNPQSARQMNKVGWIVLIVLVAITVLAIVAYLVFVFVMLFVVAGAATTGV